MRVIRVELGKKKKSMTPIVACIGYFDGLHLGHRKLIEETVGLAKEMQCESALISFDPDPWTVVKGMKNVKHLSTMRQRMDLAVGMGIDNIVLLSFTQEMAALSPQEFVEKVLGNLHLQGLVCGFDFHFGRKGEGSGEDLAKLVDYPVKIIPSVEDAEGKISSTRISKCLVDGKMEDVNRMLGYTYNIVGKVVHGKHRGTSMGFPTANVQYDDEYLLPKLGLYAGYVTVCNERYPALINIGVNPTFKDIRHVSLEAYIFNFHKDIYGMPIKVEFYKFMREEISFRTKDNLILQMEQDVRDAQRYFKNHA